jgi:hypothetical protein
LVDFVDLLALLAGVPALLAALDGAGAPLAGLAFFAAGAFLLAGAFFAAGAFFDEAFDEAGAFSGDWAAFDAFVTLAVTASGAFFVLAVLDDPMALEVLPA